MKIKYFLPMVCLVSTFVFVACQKDDYDEIIGVCPVVLFTDPTNQATGVPLDKVITITFNTDMNPATFTTSAIILQGADTIAGMVTYAGTTASFTPVVNLLPFTQYTGTVTTVVKDITGNALQQKHIWTFTTDAAGVNIGTTGRFGILASSGITSTGFSEVRDADVGISPAFRSSIYGFPQGIVINGEIYASDDVFPAGIPAMLSEATDDLTQAYLRAESAVSSNYSNISGNLGGLTLTPGIYNSSTAIVIESGDLILDAQGDQNAYWIIRTADDLITQGSTGGDVILTGGAQAGNVFWQTAGSASIGSNTSFKGTILSLNDIQMGSNATVEGRLLSRTGKVVLENSNIIHKP